jgi:hypothetical protein
MDNPAVWCTKHAKQFVKGETEVTNDGTQFLIKQYWKAECGCAVEITLAVREPGDPTRN